MFGTLEDLLLCFLSLYHEFSGMAIGQKEGLFLGRLNQQFNDKYPVWLYDSFNNKKGECNI